MHLLEEEMVVNELLLNSGVHAFERVESSLEVTFEGIASGDNLSHDLVSLLLGDSWTKRVVSQVSSNSNSSGLDHSTVFLGEFSVLDAVRGHVRSVFGFRAVLVVVGNALVEELVELSVSVVRSSVDSDTGVLVLDTREDASFESNTVLVLLILVFLPNILGEALAKCGFAVSGECREFLKILRGLKITSRRRFFGGVLSVL